MSVRAAHLALVPLVLLVTGETSVRAADERDKEACIRAVEHAQVARIDGKLREAREGFVTCARAVCPEAIRQDCTRWVTDVDASIPSVVFEAVWVDGHDATGTRVLIDGKPTDAEPGRAVVLDPGEHTFHFEVAGAAPVETRNVVREGEKNRIVRVTFTPLTPPAPPAPTGEAVAPPSGSSSTSVPAPANLWQPVPSAEQRPHAAGRGPIPLAAYILGGVGLASFAGFGYLAIDGTSRLDGMRSGPGSCAPDCKAPDVNSARNEILAGDILGYVGLAATGVAIWLALARP